ncbi:iron chaperone [Geodermatophilus amargosae]|uniref:iron chaperone n=1 Tax=Geodermatophilus amargosae TaxID=1296565 RepID=UPI0034DF049D
MSAPGTVEEYLAALPEEAREALEQVRAAVLRGMPGATETVRYGMPAAMLGSRYGLHFAAWKKHAALYPVPVFDGPGEGDLEAEVAPLRSGKDAVHLVYRRPVPVDLVERIAAAVAARRQG